MHYIISSQGLLKVRNASDITKMVKSSIIIGWGHQGIVYFPHYILFVLSEKRYICAYKSYLPECRAVNHAPNVWSLAWSSGEGFARSSLEHGFPCNRHTCSSIQDSKAPSLWETCKRWWFAFLCVHYYILKSFSYPRLVSFIWARDSHHSMPHVSCLFLIILVDFKG